MNYEIRRLEENHKLFGVPVRERWSDDITVREIQLRKRLVREEAEETMRAIREGDRIEEADGLGDVLYVVAGTAVQTGIRPEVFVTFADASTELLKQAVEDFESSVDAFVSLQRNFLIETSRQELFRKLHEEVNKAMVKLEIVCKGIANVNSIPWQEVFDEIHASNMRKVGEDGKPIFDAGGKYLKPSGWKKPDIAGILKKRDA
jgi:predicted HAD superfamily Cof-like phosphohydrolase